MRVNKGPFIKWWCFVSKNFSQVLRALQGFRQPPQNPIDLHIFPIIPKPVKFSGIFWVSFPLLNDPILGGDQLAESWSL